MLKYDKNTEHNSVMDKYTSLKDSLEDKVKSIKTKAKNAMYTGLVAATLFAGCSKNTIDGGYNFSGYIDCKKEKVHLTIEDYGNDDMKIILKEPAVGPDCDTNKIVSTYIIEDGKVVDYRQTGIKTGFEKDESGLAVTDDGGEIDKELLSRLDSKVDQLKSYVSKLKKQSTATVYK